MNYCDPENPHTAKIYEKSSAKITPGLQKGSKSKMDENEFLNLNVLFLIVIFLG